MIWTPKVGLIKKDQNNQKQRYWLYSLNPTKKGVHIFMRKNNRYSPEFKIKVVKEYLEGGISHDGLKNK